MISTTLDDWNGEHPPSYYCESVIEEKFYAAAEHLCELKDITLKTQFPIGPYFADFLLVKDDRCIVVECDGFEFHSTAEDMLHDKQRDRFFTASGFRFLHYTGKEINANAGRCAGEAVRILVAA